MKLITKEIQKKLDDATDGNMVPIFKLFVPWGAATWLICEQDKEEKDIFYGFANLGMGCTEFGSISLSEITNLKGPAGLRVERDRSFEHKEGTNYFKMDSLVGV